MIIIRAPFRIPLGGGGTDLPSYYSKYEGSLITATINKYMYVNINEPSVVDKIKISYSKTEIVDLDSIDNIQHDIVRETLKYLNINRPLEIHSMADLSAGTGMGSSSAFTVALLTGLNTFNRRFLSLKEIAEEACKIEMDLCKKPIGKQDQYATTFGGINELNINKKGFVTVIPLKLKQETIYELENRLMVFYTNIDRDTNQIITEQNEKINNDIYIINSMHKIKNIGKQIKNTLLNDDIDNFGYLLNEHWLIKKSISNQMSSTNIDNWYNIGIQNGALGGKIMGAGGGGFFLFCVKPENRKKLKLAMENQGLKYMNFKFDFEGVKVLANL
ncbi:galactokinase [Candidatus Dojkabacteria bacterium]|jgi:D-glycero-alpha-D-manno-heptose-7-phosphate kinase|nr:galactokinase [Candidatus Dojkabacteria bacterium]